MLIAVSQLDPVVGDVAANCEAIIGAVSAAKRAGASILVSTEMGLLGYPPRDLVLRAGTAAACMQAAERVAAAFPEMTLLLGLVRPLDGAARPCANSVALCRGGRVESVYDKRLLPTYDIFDEERYFTPGRAPLVFEHGGRKVGVLICEDLWRAVDARSARRYRDDPAAETVAAGAQVLLVPGASPFVLGKHESQRRLVESASKRLGVPVVVVNQVGGNDDLIFDGGSMVAHPNGGIVRELPRFREAVEVVDLASSAGSAQLGGADPIEELYHALVLGIRDYMMKTGHRTAVLGLSGGIDSALVAALVSAAIGPSNVHGLLMPGPYSSRGSITDAIEVAERLRLGSREILGISEAHTLLHDRLALMLGRFEGVADENLQSRLRGLTLMAFSNATGGLVMSTGNKSEFATGYATLYGDMSGGLAPIGDLVKGRVYQLARWINESWASLGFTAAPIPEPSLSKAPSAELRPNQTDQDTLPPYERLDRLVEMVVEEELDAEEISRRSGEEIDFVRRWCAVIDREQYKRDQAPVILKVTSRAFGRGRPMPIAAQSRSIPRADP